MTYQDYEGAKFVRRVAKVLGWIFTFILVGVLATYLPTPIFALSVLLIAIVTGLNFLEGMAKNDVDNFEGNE